jgi:hypothetical protein
MKKAMLIVLAILVMATLVVAQDSTTAPTPKSAPNTTWLNADGDQGHISHGCMLCHAPHSANAVISSAAVKPACFPGTPTPSCFTAGDGGFAPGNFSGAYPGITSIVTGFSGGPVQGSIYLWGTAITNQTYTTWEGTTINQSNITTGKNSAVVHTLLCMSCHDNANSSYGMGAGYGFAPGTEYGTGNTVTDSYSDHIGLSTINSAGTGWNTNSTLNNSHPVHVVYTGLVANGEWLINPDGTFQDATFVLDSVGDVGHPAKLWIDGGVGSGGPAYVECTSCHDPHRETVFAYWTGTKYQIGAAGSTLFYLRGPYSNPEVLSGPSGGNSGVVNANFCRSCHYDKSEMYANNSGGAK